MKAKILLEGNSLPEAFYRNVMKNPGRVMFAKKQNSYWKETRAEEALEFVLRTMAGLKRLGFEAGDRICIFSENREEWTLTDYAAQWLGGCTTSIYTTSTSDEIHYILQSSGSRYLFVSDQNILNRATKWSGLDRLQAVIAWEEGVIQTSPFPLISRTELLKEKLAIEEAQSLFSRIRPEDMSILLYTSGTTGEPKGVVLSQSNICSNIRQMHSSMPLSDLNCTMSFLPLCHIYERALQSTLLLADIKICYAESLDKLVENMAEVQPDIMIGVPRVFEKMYVKIQERLRNAPLLKKIIAKLAFQIGRATIPYRLKARPLPLALKLLQQVADILVFNKIRAITGGRLKYFISGGAPLSPQIAEFFFQAGITILEGYGLSETIILSYNRPGKIKFGTVGQALDDTEFKIAEDGEILVRGPQVTKGYFGNPEMNEQAFTEEGFFRTGDIGEIDSENYLTITDRKKELLKTAGGKYVAPQPIENKIKTDPLVENVVLVGDRRKYVTALIVPNLELCRSWGNVHGLSLDSYEDCAKSKALRLHYQSLIDSINADLPRYATIKYFCVLDSAFSIASGELTPTLKLKRRVIEQKFKSQIDEMYPEEDRLVSSI